MALRVKSSLLLLVFFCLIETFGFAQTQPFSEDQWEDVAKDLDYSEDPPKERSSDVSMPDWNFDLNGKVIRYFIFGAVLAVLLYFIIRYLLNLKTQKHEQSDTFIEVKTIEEAEENPMRADLQKLIAVLVGQQKYREATRAYYLFILQTLYRQKMIEWKKPKTNIDYVNDVSQLVFHQHFKQLTGYFERIWYGHQPVSVSDFENIEPRFKNLLLSIENEKK